MINGFHDEDDHYKNCHNDDDDDDDDDDIRITCQTFVTCPRTRNENPPQTHTPVSLLEVHTHLHFSGYDTSIESYTGLELD